MPAIELGARAGSLIATGMNQHRGHIPAQEDQRDRQLRAGRAESGADVVYGEGPNARTILEILKGKCSHTSTPLLPVY